jgi:hypothetical protein
VLQKQATAGTVACSYCCSATHTLAAVHGHAPTYPSGFEYLSLLHVSLPDRLYPSPLNACLVTCTPPGAEEMSASSRPRPLYSQAVPSRALQLSQFPVSHPRPSLPTFGASSVSVALLPSPSAVAFRGASLDGFVRFPSPSPRPPAVYSTSMGFARGFYGAYRRTIDRAYERTHVYGDREMYVCVTVRARRNV